MRINGLDGAGTTADDAQVINGGLAVTGAVINITQADFDLLSLSASDAGKEYRITDGVKAGNVYSWNGVQMELVQSAGGITMYGLARNLEIAGVGTTSTEFFGFICSVVPGADVQITPAGGAAVTTIDSGTFTAGQIYPIHGTSVTITTSGEFLLFTADD